MVSMSDVEEDFEDDADDDLDDIEALEDDVDIDDLDADLDEDPDDEDGDLAAVEQALSQKEQNARALAIRRALEQRAEERRLHDDLDYLDD